MQERFQQVAKTLRKAIATGRYAPGRPFPSRQELAAVFGVTRSTIDRSVAMLAREGLLVSRQGAPTCVADAALPYAIAYIGRVQDFNDETGFDRRRIAFYDYPDLAGAAARRRLQNYDGIVWHLPPNDALEWIDSIEGHVPQIVVNRHFSSYNYVSTAHEEAIRQITTSRLKACPGAAPYFLLDTAEPAKLLGKLRSQGFIEACREHNVYYEILDMPVDFQAKLELLEQRARECRQRPILVVSAYWQATGAVIRWAHDKPLRWKQDVFYSDFDNQMEEHVWGLRVTTFRQNYRLLVANALKALIAIIQGKEKRVQQTIPPELVEGDT